uniref:Uncharacterized protein n=1 Tax=Anguilla anguilla TaxID=7936 RepID=A0A0E9SX50_ANGAN
MAWLVGALVVAAECWIFVTRDEERTAQSVRRRLKLGWITMNMSSVGVLQLNSNIANQMTSFHSL